MNHCFSILMVNTRLPALVLLLYLIRFRKIGHLDTIIYIFDKSIILSICLSNILHIYHPMMIF